MKYKEKEVEEKSDDEATADTVASDAQKALVEEKKTEMPVYDSRNRNQKQMPTKRRRKEDKRSDKLRGKDY